MNKPKKDRKHRSAPVPGAASTDRFGSNQTETFHLFGFCCLNVVNLLLSHAFGRKRTFLRPRTGALHEFL